MDKGAFVENIKKYCALRGVKPTVACRESGAGVNFINKIMTQGSVPSVERVQLLANYLGVTVSELLGERLPDAPVLPEQLAPVTFKIAKAYDRADSGTQAAVRKLLDVKNDET